MRNLFLLYRSLILSVIDYGSIAYNSALDSEKYRYRLDVIRHKALRLACGAFCSTAAGELPPDLRRSQHEIKYSVKVKATEGHPAIHRQISLDYS